MKQSLFLLAIISTTIWSCRPTEYKVSREIVIEAPQQLVFQQVNNHKNRDAWSPWEKMDPNMKKSYEGPESGVGAIYKWSGNDDVGTGSLEIVESEPNAFIRSKLSFTSPFEAQSTIEWHFSSVEGGTKAEWVNIGSLPGYLFWMDEKMMEDQMGPDFEKGLKGLKTVSEKKASALPKDVLQTAVAPINYYYVVREVNMDEFDEDLFSEAYDKIYTYLGEDAALVREPPFAIFHEWDVENNRAKFEVAVAVESDKMGNETVKRGTTYEGKVVMRIHQGPYEQTEAVHEELNKFIETHDMKIAGSPWESYVVGPADDPEPSEWVTEIYYPVSE